MNRLTPNDVSRDPDFQRTTASYEPGARTLPREFYLAPEIFAQETERIHAMQWNCVGRTTSLANPGDYFLTDVAAESIIVLRDRNDVLRAFFNVCRHRGTRLCSQPAGHLSETIQCPYHAWTYTTDGRLIGAPHMLDVPDFDRTEYSLYPAGLAEWEGFLFINIADQPIPFEEAWAPMIGRLARFHLGSLRPGHGVSYSVNANWKLIFQNYSECLHCPVIHPELAAVLPYQSGANDLTRGPFLGGYMQITEPNRSATMSGRACGRLVNETLPLEDRNRAFYYSLMPNLLLSIHPDYVNYYVVTPVRPDSTVVRSEWLFHPSNDTNPDFNPDDAIQFWDVTNRQDWDIVERSHAGITSRRYRPGPYSPRESIPAAWDREYRRLMGR
ncbi:MAG: aromatic ring-hydroxylating oxygenase subunit alpha [Longimicrobiales bacterium]